MALVEEAFSRIFPGTEFGFAVTISYSGKFKPYNATVRKRADSLHFSMSSSWKSVSDEIVIGLVQHLLVRILRKDRSFASMMGGKRITSMNMQLYDDFIRNISEVASPAAGGSDELLESSFARVNGKYFFGVVDKPGLAWGSGSFRKLASYDYHTNTITVSSIFSEAPSHLLDYLMYHEMLHKKLKFSSSNGRTTHHGSEFRRLERNFESSGMIEAELNSFIRSTRRARQPGSFRWRRLLLLR